MPGVLASVASRPCLASKKAMEVLSPSIMSLPVPRLDLHLEILFLIVSFKKGSTKNAFRCVLVQHVHFNSNSLVSNKHTWHFRVA